MSRSVTFNGITRYRPGAITRVNADALNQVGVSSSGVLGLIGEADGGAPGSETGIVSISDPARAAEMFRSGPLVDAIKLAFQSSGDPLVPGGAAEVVVYKTNDSTRSEVRIPSDTDNVVSTTVAGTTSTTTNIEVSATLETDALVGRWAEIEISSLPGSPTFLRRIVENATNHFTISPALPAAPTAGDAVNIRADILVLRSRDYGAHTTGVSVTLDYEPSDGSYQVISHFEGEEQISPSLGGESRNYLHVLYRGGPVAASESVEAGSTTSQINVTPSSLVAGAHADQTLVLMDSSGNVKAVTKVTNNTDSSISLAVDLAAAPVAGDLVELRDVTDATGEFKGAHGKATSFTTTIVGVVGDNLDILISPSMTLRELAAAINSNTNYVATIPSQINPDTTLASAFDFGDSTRINLQTSYSGTVARSGFRQDLAEIVAWINEESEYMIAERASEQDVDGGAGVVTDYPNTTGDPLPWMFQLHGGSRGISTNSSFQAAFDAFRLRVIDEVVPLIDEDLVNEGHGSTATWESVAQQLRDHVMDARGVLGMPRGAWMGFQGTKDEYIAAANSLNDMDIQLTSQYPTIVSSSGTLVEKQPRDMAVMGASMRLGVPEVGEPLTHKYLRVSAVRQHRSWNPSDPTDAADLIRAGCLFAETIPGQGTRWVRDITTWVRDDNLAYSEGSVRDVVRYVEYELKTLIERRFTGRKASPATISAVKDTAATLLELFRAENIIVDSTDPATGQTIRAYHNLKVYSSGDVIRLNVGIFPVPGINFQLIDMYLSLPTQAA